MKAKDLRPGILFRVPAEYAAPGEEEIVYATISSTWEGELSTHRARDEKVLSVLTNSRTLMLNENLPLIREGFDAEIA